MSEQGKLFQMGHPDQPPSKRHSPTSVAAACDIKDAVNALQRQVLGFLAIVGVNGATDEEMQRWLNMNPSTQRPRRVELVAKGLVRDSGFTRKTASGRNAVVWRVV